MIMENKLVQALIDKDMSEEDKTAKKEETNKKIGFSGIHVN